MNGYQIVSEAITSVKTDSSKYWIDSWTSNDPVVRDSKKKGILPIYDLQDNNFIGYSIKLNLYVVFNATDDKVFDKHKDLNVLAKKYIK